METDVHTDQKNLSEYSHSKPEQLSLFELTEPSEQCYSNTIELYDSIPKYFWGNRERENEKYLEPIDRQFEHKGVKYTVYVSPARLKDKDGVFRDYLPGQREELVEDVLRKLVCEGKGVFLDEHAGVVFTLYELQKELREKKHCHNIAELKEAIMICASSTITLQSQDGKTIVMAPFFTTVGLQTQDDWKEHGKTAKAYIRFNPLVTKSIKEKTFRLLNYDTSMSYKKVLARWLHKRMSHNYKQAHYSEPYTIMLSTIIRDSGVKEYTQLRDNVRKVKEALNEMIKKEVVATYQVVKIKEGRKIVDSKFIIRPHELFVKDVKFANKRQTDMRKEEELKEKQEKFQQFKKQLTQNMSVQRI